MRNLKFYLVGLSLLCITQIVNAQFIVTNTLDDGPGSLRQAIVDANAVPGSGSISFNIPVADPGYVNNAGSERWTIQPLTLFPQSTETLILDATTQPGTGNFRIALDGQGGIATGIDFEAGNNEIYGFYITGFNDGLDIFYLGGGSIVGGIGKGNTIVSCSRDGITAALADGHVIKGNFIGTDENGGLGLGNLRGINFTNASSSNIIGGINPGEGNIISGNTDAAVRFNNGGSHQIIGNYIGTDPSGLLAIPNGSGIALGTAGSSIITNNVISSNTGIALQINTSNSCVIQGNNIGVGSDGITALGNGEGINILTFGSADNNVIGGNLTGEANIIAYSTGFGINYTNSNPSFNQFIGNNIFCNGDKGINLLGGNQGIVPPYIETYGTGTVSGSGTDGDVVHLYRDNTACAPLQGAEYLGSATVAGGVWTINEASILPSDLINATATDALNNTSEFAINLAEILVFMGDPLTGQQIFNGQLATVDMGTSNQGVDLDRIFTIQNKSSSTLTLPSVGITILGNYSIVGSVPTSIPPNSSESFLVRISGAVQGVFANGVFINSDDADESSFLINLTGEILPPLPAVTSVVPTANAIAIPLNSNIDITFSETMDGTTVNSNTFIVTGEQSGVVSGAFTVVGNSISFNPTNDFKTGDLIRVTLTPGVKSLAGVSVRPYTYEFRGTSITGPTVPNLLFNEATTTISTVADGANSVFAIDVDGDGDMDVLSASEFDNKIAWYENDGSQGFTERTVLTSGLDIQHVYAADIDQDGDIDILSASRSNGILAWHENDGLQNFTERTISFTGTTFAYYMALPRDVDGDGDIDIIGANRVEDKIAWYENDGAQNFTERVVSLNANSIRSVYGIDVDGDGDMDLLSASVNDDKIAWYENDGNQVFTERVISLTANSARIVYATDMDNDGDVDVLSASFSDDKIAWYENDGLQNFTERVISLTADGARGMYAIDVDADGDMDVMSASRRADKVVWYENDGSQGFNERLISSTTNSVRWVYATDIDGDGDIDALSASTNDDKIAWFENGGITPVVPLINVVSVTPTENSTSIALNANITFTFDQAIDGATAIADNILIAGEQTGFINGTFSGLGTTVITFDPSTDFNAGEVIRIYLSSAVQSTGGDPLVDGYRFEFRTITQDGPETPDLFYDDPATIISSTATAANVVFTADIDGDGDMDVLSSSQTADKIAWYQNDGNQGFTEFIVSTNAIDIQHVYAVDLDKDGDMDLMSASRTDDKISWYENDGAQNFTEKNITLGANGAYMAYAYDIDSDGDMDVLVASRYDDEVTWYENDGLQNFTERIISLNANSVRSIYGIDVDGDGDMDVLSASSNDNKIAWYENDGAENFIERVISTNAMSAKVVYAMDMDGDGDIDVLSASYTDDKIAWYENDGTQQFTERVISLTADGARSVYAADADGDGDIDVFSASRFADKVAWYENDGLMGFTEHVVTLGTNSVRGVYVSDLDGDGDVDLLAASSNDNKIVWFKNTTLVCYNPPSASADLDQTICEGDGAILNGSFIGASTITWTSSGDGGFDDATKLSAIYSPGIIDISSGTVTLTITTDDPDGSEPCVAATDNIIITIEATPTIDAGIDQDICTNDAVTLTGLFGGSATSATWTSDGDGTFDDPTLPSAIYSHGTNDVSNGTVTLTFTTVAGVSCASISDFIVVAINQPITVIDQAVSLDVEETITIDVTTGGSFNTGDNLTTTLLTQPAKGTTTINMDGTIDFTSFAGTVDADSFDFEVCNQCGQCSSATVDITINNVAPSITISSQSGVSGDVITIDLFSGITDINNNIDFSSLTIIVQPTSGATATIDANGILTIDYTGIKFAGTDIITIEVCDLDGLCTQFDITIEVAPPGVVVFNAVSPNGDGKHDFLEIEGAEFFPNNRVKIMNRWGEIVYEIKGYDNSNNKFSGTNNGGGDLPLGTYYYVISLGEGSEDINGFFSLRR